MVIDRETGKWAIYGGLLLGGGGGGDPEEGLRILELALSYTDGLKLHGLDVLPPSATVLTASLVGSPASESRYVAPRHYQRVYEIFKEVCPEEIGGIITNEMGGQSSTNGWVLAAMTGLPLLDAPCNGRAHPTGAMGSLGLAQEPGYRSVQSAAGGRDEYEVEITAKGELGRASGLIRSAAEAAGGFVTVLRNPVSAAYVAEHGAVGALSQSIEIGRELCRCLGDSTAVVQMLADTLGAIPLCQRGVVTQYELVTAGGFDRGLVRVEGEGEPLEVSVWNEYMTAEQGGRRLATFPDLIALLDGDTGVPLTSAMLQQGQQVVVIKIPQSRLKLSSSMRNRSLLADAEKKLGKELIRYVL